MATTSANNMKMMASFQPCCSVMRPVDSILDKLPKNE